MLGVKELKLVADRQNCVDVLMDSSKFADKVLKGGKFVNVITREIYTADVGIQGEYILMVGNCDKLIGPKTEVVDITGKFITPGFIDAHMHFESAMLTITEFSRLSLPTGTTCLISDPHEIGNVLGPVGIKAMAEEAALMPHHVYCRVPALTPDSPGLETAGYDITSKDLPETLNYPTVTGIGETQGISAMRFVYDNNYNVVRDTIVSTVYARSIGKGVDGNAPELFAEDLASHIICAGTDISCHETTTKEECVEKLRYGVHVLMREGSTQRNMPECIKALTEEKVDSRRMILATDDMLAEDIAKTGHMNDIIRRTIKEGVSPVEAIQMATINPATWLGLTEIGVLAPGKFADIAIIDGKLEDMNVDQVFLKGQKIAEKGKVIFDLKPYIYPDSVKNSVKRKPITADDLKVAAEGSKATVRCIGLILDQNLSEALEVEMMVENGFVSPMLEDDLLPIAVVGRHGQMDIGKTFVNGFKMQYGAFAETVSHDTHNIIVVGTNYEDMASAVNRVIEIQGGVVLVKDSQVIGEMALPIAGLLTDELSASELTEKMIYLHELASKELHCKAHAPFMHLAFLSLSTSPKWKITDKGVIDANNYCVLSTIK
ncbi:adenine deaminase [Acidaminobacter hydrogenoformans]|uniref:Adenine deaminase n=1 Tax=Acidaminobacter hydrogenoformans DSM 2784 TaxID=1120920 RepID=A0A1G5S2T6_9FIRM|nr:adenine deaminase C-terminal domain-containing protein [Acidaminobacter hydrogenoformans]SCZ79879.1 Adenine deaminase [Acidaminobacter hydrogenoformans DSM 2784]